VAALFAPDGEFVSPSGAITSARAEIQNLLAGEFQERLQGTTLTIKVDATKFVKQDAALAKGTFSSRASNIPWFRNLGERRVHFQDPGNQWLLDD
jgi:uncharacterized protein (TIGR02246 family)